ncbi:MAG: GIY-YIG nuclease family protein [Acidiferrobacterales bacterium]
MSESWHIYILECADHTLYTGITMDVEKRLDEHNTNNNKAAKYVRARRPAKIVYRETAGSRSKALKREHEIKQLTRQMKLILISEGAN